MRLNKEMIALSVEAKAVEWPQPKPLLFQRFETRLHEVLKANDFSAKGFDFDEYSGHFYWTMDFSIRLAGHPGSFERTFIIDPKLPIEAEVARVIKERDEIQAAVIDAARAHYAAEQLKKAKAEQAAPPEAE